MERQDKISNKNNRTNRNGEVISVNLGTKKNDECYTSMTDILTELKYWAALGKFKGKNIICPCDWDITDNDDIFGIKITYKEDMVEANVFKAVKSVIIQKYNDWCNCEEEAEVPQLVEYELKEDEIEDFLRNKLTCNFLRTFTQNARRWGIKSITASGYNPANGKGIPFQEVDYSQYDICVTNPPFSLYGEFMETIVGKIDFIILAPFLNRANPCIGLYLMLKQAYLGAGVQLALTFNNPTSSNKYKTKLVACDWITSFSEAQEERNSKQWKSGVEYNLYKDEYVEMTDMTMKDGHHPIRVPSDAIPEDYDGWMFTPINVLNRINQEDYEWYITNCKGYLNSHSEINPLAHKLTDLMVKNPISGKGFHGVLLRKKQK